jgi:hypothetical protein
MLRDGIESSLFKVAEHEKLKQRGRNKKKFMKRFQDGKNAS